MPLSSRFSASLILFCPEPGEPVGDIELELVGALHDLLAFLGTNVVSDLNCILLVVHEQHLQVSRAAHKELVEAILQAEAGLLVRAVTDGWHQCGALEAAAHPAINATRLAPGWVHTLEAVSLEAWELLHALLHDLALVCRCRHLCRALCANCWSGLVLTASL